MLRIAAALVIALAIGSAVSAAPAGRITATLKTDTRDVAAGRPWGATISIRAGRRRPFSGRATVLAAGPLGRRTFTTRRARAGLFRARIVFPAGGRWTLSVRALGRAAHLASLEVRGAGPRISRPHGFEIAEEHGDLIVPDLDGTSLYEVNLRTLARTVVGRGFDHPLFLNFGPGGYLYVADAARIYRFEPDGSKTPIAGNGTRGSTGDGGPATAAQLGGPGDFAFDGSGNLYIAEYDNGVRMVTPDGRIDTLAGIGREGYSGDGWPARNAAFGAPHGLDVLPDGTVLVADSHNGVVRRIDGVTRVVTTIASGFGAPVCIEAGPNGSFYVADASVDHIVRVAADGSRRNLGRGLNVPTSVGVDRSGNVYVSEFEGRSIRRIDARTGRMTRVVG
jgi:DNA-binding beta-propeller fold protein YncE